MIKVECKTRASYDIHDLLELNAEGFENLDSRVTSVGGKPNQGDRVVIINKTTGVDVTVALNDREVDELIAQINRMFSRSTCAVHGCSYPWYVLNPPCTCAAAFSSRLLANRAIALANSLHSRSDELEELTADLHRGFALDQGWTDDELAELDRSERARARWIQAELRRLRA
jgi:hypothetical protein